METGKRLRELEEYKLEALKKIKMKNHLYIIPFLPSLSLIITGTDGVVVMNPGVVDVRLTTNVSSPSNAIVSSTTGTKRQIVVSPGLNTKLIAAVEKSEPV